MSNKPTQYKVEVDEILAEKDREIALLKERICNGDVSRLTWIDDCFDKDKEIAELKDKCRMHDFFWEGCGFKKLGFKNSIDVRDYCDELKRQNEDLLPKCRKANRELRHQKYKRCLAMAKYCEAMRGHYLSYEEPKWFWYRKWSERWLELAEKFKDKEAK